MTAPQWHFEDFRLDLGNACLWHGAESLALPPKALHVLHYLVTHPGRLVTKDELLDHIWPETAVTDAVVRVAIGALRKAIADTRRPFRVIATVSRWGYRFLPTVTLVDPPAAAPQEAGLAVPVVLAPQEAGNLRRCAICQHPLSQAARFCATCGAPVTETCPTCGQVVPLPATFCPGCGQRLEAVLPAESPDRWPTDVATSPQAGLPLPTPRAPTGDRQLVTVPERTPLTYTPTSLVEKIRTSRTALAGERKQVTVLFADIKDSLELIRSLDPEAAQQLLDPALHAMMDAVHRYEGTVNQVLGDGIMALFGAPIAHEDHAARACYAALAMQAALRDYAEEVRRVHGVALQSRIGLNSGEVVVRTIRNDLHMDYSAVGQTTHLAARLEQLASPDTILIATTTVRLVEGLVRVKVVGPVAVKGLAEPIEVWELLGASGQRWRLQTARARGLTRFVGRQTELAALHAVLTQAEAGHGQVAAVLGEAGVGKSRLVDEFVQAAHAEGWLVLDSAAVSYSQATPYFPVLDLLRRFCHLEEREDMHTIQTKVTAQVLTLDAAFQDTIPALLALLDALPADSPFLQLDPPQRRQHTHTALKRVLLRASQEQPVLLVVEDLHWLDTETQAVLGSLGESVPTARLLLLVTYRPEYRHGWGSKTYYTQLRLDPLPPASTAAFLQALLGDDPSLAPLTQFLSQRTEGNPFFLEESVRTLVEMQVVLGNQEAYYLAGELPRLSVPATVQAVLAARIDRLPPEEKHLLQTAAVIGTEVPLRLLQTVGELPEETLCLGLTHLQDAEFLYEVSLFPELVYIFKHALTQEVAYSSLLHERRRVLHARIVEALETLAGDRVVEHVERLAHHALRGEVWGKAVTYCQQAGEKAKARSAYREAVAAFEQALEALRHLPESRVVCEQAIDLRLALDFALWRLGDWRRVLASLREAEALAERLGDQRRLAHVSSEMADGFRILGDHERGLMAGERALTLAIALEDQALQVEANAQLGLIYYHRGDYGRAIEALRQVVTARARHRHRKCDPHPDAPEVWPWSWLLVCFSQVGAFVEGRAMSAYVLRLAETTTRPFRLAVASFGAGLLSLRQGDLSAALAILERGLAVCQTRDLRDWVPTLAGSVGYAYTLAGRLPEALELLEQAVGQYAAMREGTSPPTFVVWLGEAYLRAGRLEEAYTQAQSALVSSRAHQERGHEAYALQLLGESHTHRNPLEVEPAEAHYRQALAIANELGMRPLQAHCYLGLGTLYNQMGRAQQARTALSTAIELYRTMEMTFWLPQAEAALAQVA